MTKSTYYLRIPTPPPGRYDLRKMWRWRKAPARGVPADVMIVRTRPSVHGNSLPETCPNSKLLTKGRYELSSVRSSCTYP